MKQQEAHGRAEKLKGGVKESVGIITGNRALEKAGGRQRAAGAVEETVGKARRKVDELAGSVAKVFKK